MVNIIERTYDDYGKQKYWLDQGFPAIAYQVYGSAPFRTPGEMTADTPQVKAWKQTEYSYPTEKFILGNPIFATFAPVAPRLFIQHYSFYESIFPPLASGVIESEKTIDLNSKTMNVIPNYLSKLELPRTFWWPESEYTIKFLLISIFGTIFISLLILLRNKGDYNLKVILLFSYLFLPSTPLGLLLYFFVRSTPLGLFLYFLFISFLRAITSGLLRYSSKYFFLASIFIGIFAPYSTT
jgi:hypothetical protein